MKRIKLKLILASTLAITSSICVANENDLLMMNNLKHDLTFKVHTKDGSRCSSDFGVISPHSYAKVSEASLIKSCPYYADSCMAFVYLSNNCTGDEIAYVKYSGYSGVESVTLHETAAGTPEIQSGKNFLIFRSFK